jgi:hypothetical protein
MARRARSVRGIRWCEALRKNGASRPVGMRRSTQTKSGLAIKLTRATIASPHDHEEQSSRSLQASPAARLEPSRASYSCSQPIATIFLGVTKAWETGGELRTRRSSIMIITPSKKMQDGPLRTPRYRLLDQWEACRRLSLLSASRKKEKTGSFSNSQALISARSVSLLRMSHSFYLRRSPSL